MKADLLVLLTDSLVILCLARCLLQWTKLDSQHPLIKFCIQTTEWLIKPLRKAAPIQGKWDIACLLAGFLLYYMTFMLITWMALPDGFSGKLVMVNFLFAILGLLKSTAYVLLFGLIIRMILSVYAPYSPLLPVLHQIFAPLSQPFSFLKMGRYDFSGSLLALLLWVWVSSILPQVISKLNILLLQ